MVLLDRGQGSTQQSGHLLPFVQKEALVVFGLGQGERFSKPGEGMKLALLGKGCPRYQHQDLQLTASPSLFVRLQLPAFEQMEGLLGLSLCDEQAGDNEVFVLLVQSWQALPLRSARRGPALCRCQISCRKCEAGLYRRARARSGCTAGMAR